MWILDAVESVLHDEIMQFLVRMQKDSMNTNSSSIVAVLRAVAQANALRHGKAMHGLCVRKWLQMG